MEGQVFIFLRVLIGGIFQVQHDIVGIFCHDSRFLRVFVDAFARTHKMAKQEFRPTRLGVFSGAKAYIVYVEVLKKCRNAVGRTFCDAIKLGRQSGLFTGGPVV
jgi:hypothetical protein